MRRSLLIAFLFPLFAAADFFGGGGGAAEKVSFILCQNAACNAGTDLTNRVIFTQKLKPTACYATAKTPPVGAALVIDIRRNAVSVFSGSKLSIPSGGTAVYSQTGFAFSKTAVGDVFTVDIVSIGATNPGQDVTVVCAFK